MARRSAVPLSLGLLLIATDGVPADAPLPRVEALVVRRAGDQAVVSYDLAGALSTSVMERIESGMPVRFRHRLEILVRRGFPLLPARELARTTVETAVRYDSLTQRYHLEREIRRHGRGSGAPPPAHEEHAVTESARAMERWMTRLEEIPLTAPVHLLPEGPLRVHVEVALGRRWHLWILPGTLAAAADGMLEAEAP